MKKTILPIITMLLLTFTLSSCGGNGGASKKNLVGTWVSPYADNQKLEIRTEELRFNYRTFDYTDDGKALHLKETYPGHSIAGVMPYTLKGDTLTIDLGDAFSGYFYGRSGEVKLERQK